MAVTATTNAIYRRTQHQVVYPPMPALDICGIWEAMVGATGDNSGPPVSLYIFFPALNPKADAWFSIEQLSANYTNQAAATLGILQLSSSPQVGTTNFLFQRYISFDDDAASNLQALLASQHALHLGSLPHIFHRENEVNVNEAHILVEFGTNTDTKSYGLHARGLILVQPTTPYEHRRSRIVST